MIYWLVNKRTEIFPLATSQCSHIAHLCSQFNHAFALLVSMPSFNPILRGVRGHFCPTSRFFMINPFNNNLTLSQNALQITPENLKLLR